MKKTDAAGKIIWVEMAGFVILAAAVWVNELFDLPHHLFGTPPAAENYFESTFESAFVLSLGAVVLIFTRRLLRRIARLESFLPICSFCKKIRTAGADPEKQESWVMMEKYIGDRTGSKFSHGLCPKCFEEKYGAQLNSGES